MSTKAHAMNDLGRAITLQHGSRMVAAMHSETAVNNITGDIHDVVALSAGIGRPTLSYVGRRMEEVSPWLFGNRRAGISEGRWLWTMRHIADL